MKCLTKFGIVFSAMWLIGCLFIVIAHSDEISAINLNEWGDFLAGVTAPLALFWLVIGYFQHSEELRLNTKALEMQQEELRSQVAETALLVEAAKDQADAAHQDLQFNRLREAREAKPDLVSCGGSSIGRTIRANAKNRGGEAHDIKIHFDSPHELTFSPIDLLESNGDAVLTIRQCNNQALEFPIRFVIDCTDRIGNGHHMEFTLIDVHTFKKISHDVNTNGELNA